MSNLSNDRGGEVLRPFEGENMELRKQIQRALRILRRFVDCHARTTEFNRLVESGEIRKLSGPELAMANAPIQDGYHDYLEAIMEAKEFLGDHA